MYAAELEPYTKAHREALYRHLDDKFSRMAPFPPCRCLSTRVCIYMSVSVHNYACMYIILYVYMSMAPFPPCA